MEGGDIFVGRGSEKTYLRIFFPPPQSSLQQRLANSFWKRPDSLLTRTRQENISVASCIYFFISGP